MKICDEHFHFYDILLGGFETKPIKNTKTFNIGNRRAEHGLWLFHCNLSTNEPQSFPPHYVTLNRNHQSRRFKLMRHSFKLIFTKPYLYSCLTEAKFFAEFFTHESIWIVSLVKKPLKTVQLFQTKYFTLILFSFNPNPVNF